MPVLLVERGQDKGRALEVASGRALVVGREKSCDLAICDAMASRRHLELRRDAQGRVTVKDLRSSNGTFVNGRRLAPEEEVPLEIEDKVQVGETLLALAPDGAARSAGSRGELTGRTVGGYRVMERIGRGGMGTVYKALQLSLDRTVALKILARELSRDPARVRMFLDEARAAGSLNHPNIVQVYDVGEEGGLYFFSMEFMARGSLEDMVQRDGRLLTARALAVALDAAKGLEYAERQGIVHRDVKPANIMVNDEGTAKIGDLGIARAVRAAGSPVRPERSDAATGGSGGAESKDAASGGAESKDAASGVAESRDADEAIAGSPLYIAPEQARGAAVDHRADLYSLGATIFYVLAGEPPFTGQSPREVILKHLEEPPRPLSAIDPAIPEEVSALVARLLEKDPERRWQSAADLAEALRQLCARWPATGAAAAVEAPGGGRRSRRDAIVAAAAIAAALAIGGVGARVAFDALARERERAQAAERAAKEREAGAAEEARARAEAEARERARVAAERREADAQRALLEAEGYLGDHPEDLEGAKERYDDVAARFAGTGAEARAKERAEKIAAHLAGQDEARRVREAADSAALAEDAPERGAVAGVALGEIEALRKRLQDLRDRRKREGLAGAEAALAKALEALSARVEAAARAFEGEVEAAVGREDFEEARAALERAERTGLAGVRGWAEQKRAAVARAEEAAKERAAAENAKAVAADLDEAARADDPKRRRELRYPDLIRDLEALQKRGMRTADGRREVEFLLFRFRAQEGLRQRLLLHVNKSEKPPLRTDVGGGIEGEAVAADEDGITFRAKGGKVEVEKYFKDTEPRDLIRWLSSLPSLRGEDRFGFAAVCIDLGELDRARRELEAIARQEKALEPWVEAARARLAAAGPR